MKIYIDNILMIADGTLATLEGIQVLFSLTRGVDRVGWFPGSERCFSQDSMLQVKSQFSLA